jgi:TetR/AcrR family transcriptional repressor of nem operon
MSSGVGWGDVMRVSKEKAAENRELILSAASRLFREHGLDGVGVDALTEAAGLTHGSLYSQFGSKERLAAAALSHAAAGSAARYGSVETLDEYVTRYLSPTHMEHRGTGCAVAALAGEIPRHGGSVRESFSSSLRAMVARLGNLLPAPRRESNEALAIAASLIGALILARSVDDPALATRILDATREDLRRKAAIG